MPWLTVVLDSLLQDWCAANVAVEVVAVCESKDSDVTEYSRSCQDSVGMRVVRSGLEPGSAVNSSQLVGKHQRRSDYSIRRQRRPRHLETVLAVAADFPVPGLVHSTRPAS